MATMQRVAFVLILAAAPWLMGAQRISAPTVPQAPAPTTPAPLFKSGTELVVVHATVRDREGAHVSGLPESAFRVFENGVPRPISVFARPDEPVTIGLIIDVSGSMERLRERLAYAASRFADTGSRDDEVFAVVVGDDPVPVLPPDAPFTADPQVLRTAIADAHRPGGMTALHDAIIYGLDYLSRGTHARRALIVISDGIDNSSRADFDEVLRHTLASNAALYAVGLVDPISLIRDPGHLRKLARATGGEAYFPATNADVGGALDAIARDVHSAYALGFAPTGSPHDGKGHRVSVSVHSPDGRSLKVRARERYIAGSDAETRETGRLTEPDARRAPE